MDAVVFDAIDTVSLGHVDVPRPARGEVLLRVRTCTMGQTDIEVAHGKFGAVSFPVVPGREFTGEVVEIGADVTGIAAGERVVVDPLIGCCQCPSCHKGQTNLCSHIRIYGATLNGGLAEYCTVRAANVVGIGGLDLADAALAPTMGGVLNGLSMVGPGGRDTALIFGAGPVGLLAAMALRARGVTGIALVDRSDRRLETAESLGFRGVPCGSASLRAMRRGADLVIEATGHASVHGQLGEHAADGARILLLSLCSPDTPLALSPFEVVGRQLSLVGSHSLNRNLPEALDALASFGADISRLVTARMPLSEMARIFPHGMPDRLEMVQAVMP